MIRVQSAGFSDIGNVRKANEDRFLINEPIGLYVVADGMGGHRCGDVASRIAVETIDAYMTSPPARSLRDESTSVVDTRSAAANQLCQSILSANQQIYTQSVDDASCRGMGTTVSALYLTDNSIITANVGDSPIYLLRNGEIEILFTPHTLLNERKKIPKSMEGRVSNQKLAHVLTRAVGIRPQVGVDVVETQCFADDIIVLCSDGLSGKISREEIRDVVYENDLETTGKKLTDLANQRGGEDNITGIVVKVTSTNSSSSTGLLGRITSLFTTKKRSSVEPIKIKAAK